MAHDADKHQLARSLYLQRRSMPDIAEQCAVSLGTIKRWRMLAKDAGDNWDTARAAYQLSNQSQREFFNQALMDYASLHASVMQALRDSKEQIDPISKAKTLTQLMDSFSKAQGMIRGLYTEADHLAVANDVLSLLMEYLRNQAPDLAGSLLNHLEPFGIELSRKFG